MYAAAGKEGPKWDMHLTIDWESVKQNVTTNAMLHQIQRSEDVHRYLADSLIAYAVGTSQRIKKSRGPLGAVV